MAASVVERNRVKAGQSVFRGNQVPMWIYERDSQIFVDVSDGALRQYGYTRDEFLAITPNHLFVEAHSDPQIERANAETEEPCGGLAAVHRRKDGSQFRVRLYTNALMYEGRLARFVASVPESSTEENVGALPHTGRPSWTMGLADRRVLQERSEEAISYAERRRRRVAVVCMDIDHFDQVAAQHGDAAGDACLEQVAHWLHRRVRGMDTVARTGVHGFTVVLAELDDHFDLHRVAEALLKIFAEPVMVGEQAIVLSASIGIAVYPEDGSDLERLEHAADTAMHQARASGGHRIAMFSLESKERTELASYMQEALKARGFSLHYQPQYSPSGAVCKFEALLRLPGRDGRFIPPDLFIPIAEETGMIEELGFWVIEEASWQLQQWKSSYGSVVPIAVNVSPLQLRSPGFAKMALAKIQACGIDPRMIEFEITERAVLNFGEALEPMQELARAGIVFAVDDFGTGYSSLQHLHRLPISVLKIDRYFINRLGVQRDADAIVEAIVSMAHTLSMKVVAEGVETTDQRDAATSMGCDSIQGFLYSAAIEARYIPLLMRWQEERP